MTLLTALEKAILDPPILCLQLCVPISSLVPGLALDSPPGVLDELTGAVGSYFCCQFGELIQLRKWADGSAFELVQRKRLDLVACREGEKRDQPCRGCEP